MTTRRGSRCLVQYQHLRGSCLRCVSDALMGIFTDRPASPSADPSTVWLAHLIETTETLAASAEPCDPAIVKAFGNRLEMAESLLPPTTLKTSSPDL